MNWQFKHPQMTSEHLGYLPFFLNEADPRSAIEQLDSGYSFGGGWRPFNGFRMLPNGNLSYPGDPPMLLLAETKLRQETIRLYTADWVAVVQPDGSFQVSRMD